MQKQETGTSENRVLIQSVIGLSYLRIIMYEGVWEKEAMKLVTLNRTMKGGRRWEQLLPQEVGRAQPEPLMHRHLV